jgi:hypothetical protein
LSMHLPLAKQMLPLDRAKHNRLHHLVQSNDQLSLSA